MALTIGESAPDFDLAAVQGEIETRVRLQDFRGKKNVLVVFHPVDWTPT
jgi:peroxiredoxin